MCSSIISRTTVHVQSRASFIRCIFERSDVEVAANGPIRFACVCVGQRAISFPGKLTITSQAGIIQLLISLKCI